MLEPIRLKRPVASNSRAEPDDILALKAFLNSRGYYAAPDWGLTPFPDDALFSAIQSDLGFNPSTAIDVGIPKFVDWYKGYIGV